MSAPPHIDAKHYFVDEAGDSTLFNWRGKPIIGTEGCTSFFILGLADIPDLERLGSNLAALRTTLLADPYFKGVPSMQASARKTALFFHAKDDLPEVRREVFKLLLGHDIKFSAVVKNKYEVLNYVRSHNAADPAYRYRPDELYDHMVRRLFKERLHQHSAYRVCFAARGSSDRTKALQRALETARTRFALKHGIDSQAAVQVAAIPSWRQAGLQAVDYFLWALQRTYERRDDRFLALLWPRCSLVIDIDDRRNASYGTYYTKKKPLVSAALQSVEGYRSG